MKIGMTEILLLLIIALFVIGPDKLPEFTQKLGLGLKQFRKFSSEATKEIRQNVVEPLEEAQKPLREAMEPVAELTKEVSDDVNGIKKSFTDLTKPMKITPSKKSDEKPSDQVETTMTGSTDPARTAADPVETASESPPTVPEPEASIRNSAESLQSEPVQTSDEKSQAPEQTGTNDVPGRPE